MGENILYCTGRSAPAVEQSWFQTVNNTASTFRLNSCLFLSFSSKAKQRKSFHAIVSNVHSSDRSAKQRFLSNQITPGQCLYSMFLSLRAGDLQLLFLVGRVSSQVVFIFFLSVNNIHKGCGTNSCYVLLLLAFLYNT